MNSWLLFIFVSLFVRLFFLLDFLVHSEQANKNCTSKVSKSSKMYAVSHVNRIENEITILYCVVTIDNKYLVIVCRLDKFVTPINKWVLSNNLILKFSVSESASIIFQHIYSTIYITFKGGTDFSIGNCNPAVIIFSLFLMDREHPWLDKSTLVFDWTSESQIKIHCSTLTIYFGDVCMMFVCY